MIEIFTGDEWRKITDACDECTNLGCISRGLTLESVVQSKLAQAWNEGRAVGLRESGCGHFGCSRGFCVVGQARTIPSNPYRIP